MPAATLQQIDAPAASGSVVPAVPVRPRRKKRRAMKRILLSVFALAWIAGCIVVLSQVFSAVRTKCAGCPDCIGTAP
jgi:hypothetical protein